MKVPEELTTDANLPTEETNNGTPWSRVPSRNSPPPPSKEEFEIMNRRRLELIDKEYDGGGLTGEETAELTQLTIGVGRYLDTLSPTTEEIINHLKDLAQNAGLSLDKFDK